MMWNHWLRNPLEKSIIQAQKDKKKRFLIAWNRGLGDIALGLFALVHQIRKDIPDAQVTFLTRADLKEGFQLLGNVSTLIASGWKRGQPYDVDKTLGELGMHGHFDFILEWPDPTKWCRWQLGTLTPRLSWNQDWDVPSERKGYIAVHVNSETQYGYDKNWPATSFLELFQRLEKDNVPVALLGINAQTSFPFTNILDLRGQLSLLQLLAFIKNSCRCVLGPDSGILSLLYYLDVTFPVRVVSLWADPRQGILKQAVPSPNASLVHIPLIAPNEDLRQVSVETVYEAIGAR